MKKIVILVLLLSTSTIGHTSTIVYNNITDLNTVFTTIVKDNPNKDSTLIIFDIDDTLLEANNFVGSVKWYNWQRGRKVVNEHGKVIKINEKDKFHCMFRTLGTMFEVGSTKLTQPDAPQIVKQLSEFDFVVLTARTTIYREATERELAANHIHLDKTHLLKDGKNLSYKFNDKNRTANVTYKNGIIMASGLNKGLILKDFLSKINKTYKHIYFVDDSAKNVVNMKNEWQDVNEQMNIFHYTKVDKAITQDEINQSIEAKLYYDKFLQISFPDRFESFQNGHCK